MKYKFYALAKVPDFVGPALFFNWADVSKLVKNPQGGFLNEVKFKSVSSYAEAISYVNGNYTVESPKKKPRTNGDTANSQTDEYKPKGFYAVARSPRLNGAAIFLEWTDCQRYTSVQKGSGQVSQFKKWGSFDEAIEFIKSKAVNAILSDECGGPPTETETADESKEEASPSSMEQELRRKTVTKNDEGKLVEDAINLHKDTASIVFTDGACHGNGKKGARAGYGVFYGDGDTRNKNGEVEGAQTNQRGELTAIREAMKGFMERDGDSSSSSKKLMIFTDSDYSAKIFSSWINNWKKNGWKTSGGKDVMNMDLIREIDSMTMKLGGVDYLPLSVVATQKKLTNKRIILVHVNSHIGIHGNEQADRLANEAVTRTF